MYAMICTSPDIAYAIKLVSKFKSNPGMAHWRGAIKRFLSYLKGTANYSLCYQGENLRLIRYTNVDWVGNLIGRKSTQGCAFLINGGVISWANKKQTCNILSTLEAKFAASASVVQEDV